MMSKRKLEGYCGDLTQVYGVQECVLIGGKSSGTRSIIIDNGKGIELMVLPDKCLSISYLKFKGINVGFMSNAGICSPVFFQEEGSRGFLRNFEGGFLTTCGLSYSGASSEHNGVKRGLHGVISNTPIENESIKVVDDDGINDELYIEISGKAREAFLFGTDLQIQKSIKISIDKNEISLTDKVYNKSFYKSPLMLLYHFNYGYPFLDENIEIFSNYNNIRPRDIYSKKFLDGISNFTSPSTDVKEVVAYRTPANNEIQNGYTLVYNSILKKAIQMTFKVDQLPILNQWKSTVAGNYGLGLEPGTGHVGGYLKTKEDGALMYIEPGETKSFDILIEFLDDREEINYRIRNIEEYNKKY